MSLRVIRNRELVRNQRQKTRPIAKPKENNSHLNYNNKLKRIKSCPDISNNSARQLLISSKCISRSDSDINKIKAMSHPSVHPLSNAKSEVCLRTISVHNTESAARDTIPKLSSRNFSKNTNRRMSARSDISSASHMANAIDYQMQCRGFTDTTTIRVPIVGYEVMEERARFTVFKLRVENPFTNDCWLVLRRYTDFVRLNNKLKMMFPKINLNLPRKKLFGDNFNSVFLDNRVQGLQLFVNSIMANDTLRNCQFVREFFCLDEPPTYSESMEECRAIFEAQEETIAHLKLQLRNKDVLLMNLEQKLMSEIDEVEKLKNSLKLLQESLRNCSSESSVFHDHSNNDVVNNNK